MLIIDRFIIFIVLRSNEFFGLGKIVAGKNHNSRNQQLI